MPAKKQVVELESLNARIVDHRKEHIKSEIDNLNQMQHNTDQIKTTLSMCDWLRYWILPMPSGPYSWVHNLNTNIGFTRSALTEWLEQPNHASHLVGALHRLGRARGYAERLKKQGGATKSVTAFICLGMRGLYDTQDQICFTLQSLFDRGCECHLASHECKQVASRD